MWPLPIALHFYDLRQLFQQVGQRPPQVGVVPLQSPDVLRVDAAVGVGMDRHLIEIVGAPPLEGHQLLHRGQVNVEYIAVKCHLTHIGRHVADARLGHALLDGLQFVRPYPHTDRGIAYPFTAQRSSRSGFFSRAVRFSWSACFRRLLPD